MPDEEINLEELREELKTTTPGVWWEDGVACPHGRVKRDCEWCCPRPAGPDPERDERVRIYRDRERRRAARALDRYLETYYLAESPATNAPVAVAGERFVEAVGDYVMSRLPEGVKLVDVTLHSADGASYVQQKSDYVVTPERCGAPGPCYLSDCARDASGACSRRCAGGRCVDPEAHAEGAHDF